MVNPCSRAAFLERLSCFISVLDVFHETKPIRFFVGKKERYSRSLERPIVSTSGKPSPVFQNIDDFRFVNPFPPGT